MNFYELFGNIAGCLLRRRDQPSDRISKEGLSDVTLGCIAKELERQVRDSGFSEKAGPSQFNEKLRALTEFQEWRTPYDVDGFIYLRPAKGGGEQIVTVTYQRKARFRHLFIRIGEVLDGEAVYVRMAHLDEMVDGARKAIPVRRVLTAFDPNKILDSATQSRRNLSLGSRNNFQTQGNHEMVPSSKAPYLVRITARMGLKSSVLTRRGAKYVATIECG